MSSAPPVSAPQPFSAPAAPARGGGPPLPRHRRRGMLLIGITMTCLGALAGAVLVTATGHRVAVLVAAREIPVGATITQADLTSAEISAGPGIASIPVRQESQVTGRASTVDLHPGALVAASDLTTTAEPARGQVLVPLTLKAWQVPASGLVPGDPVLLVPTPGAAGQAVGGQAGQAAMGGNISAAVYRVSPADQNGNIVVDLLMPAGDGPAAAKQASTGQVAVLKTPPGT